ncbi:MAG: hypothetical protein OCC49_13845 [Fibrobacterales bacterium]
MKFGAVSSVILVTLGLSNCTIMGDDEGDYSSQVNAQYSSSIERQSLYENTDSYSSSDDYSSSSNQENPLPEEYSSSDVIEQPLSSVSDLDSSQFADKEYTILGPVYHFETVDSITLYQTALEWRGTFNYLSEDLKTMGTIQCEGVYYDHTWKGATFHNKTQTCFGNTEIYGATYSEFHIVDSVDQVSFKVKMPLNKIREPKLITVDAVLENRFFDGDTLPMYTVWGELSPVVTIYQERVHGEFFTTWSLMSEYYSELSLTKKGTFSVSRIWGYDMAGENQRGTYFYTQAGLVLDYESGHSDTLLINQSGELLLDVVHAFGDKDDHKNRFTLLTGVHSKKVSNIRLYHKLNEVTNNLHY